jgi:hypothetical protein
MIDTDPVSSAASLANLLNSIKSCAKGKTRWSESSSIHTTTTILHNPILSSLSPSPSPLIINHQPNPESTLPLFDKVHIPALAINQPSTHLEKKPTNYYLI